MNPKNRGVIIGMSGFYAGMLVAQLVSWPTFPKAALVMVVSVVVSLLAMVLTRPRSAT